MTKIVNKDGVKPRDVFYCKILLLKRKIISVLDMIILGFFK